MKVSSYVVDQMMQHWGYGNGTRKVHDADMLFGVICRLCCKFVITICSYMIVFVRSLSTWTSISDRYLILGHGYHTQGLTCLAVTWDSQIIVSGSQDNSVHIVNINSGQVGVCHDSSFSHFCIILFNKKVDGPLPSMLNEIWILLTQVGLQC
jgi:WD40 repeat protein